MSEREKKWLEGPPLIAKQPFANARKTAAKSRSSRLNPSTPRPCAKRSNCSFSSTRRWSGNAASRARWRTCSCCRPRRMCSATPTWPTSTKSSTASCGWSNTSACHPRRATATANGRRRRSGRRCRGFRGRRRRCLVGAKVRGWLLITPCVCFESQTGKHSLGADFPFFCRWSRTIKLDALFRKGGPELSRPRAVVLRYCGRGYFSSRSSSNFSIAPFTFGSRS